MRAINALRLELALQGGQLFLWCPVFFSLGIGGYFGAGFEPGASLWTAALCLMGSLGVVAVFGGSAARPFALIVLLVTAGFVIAGAKAHRLAAPVLEFRYYGAIEGRIVKVDRSASDAVRLTLDRVRLERVQPDRTPERVRVSLHGLQGFIDPEPGVTVILTGHLSPPGGAVEPGGYDFQRQAWFQRLGAVGYTRTPVLALAPHKGRELSLWLYRMRKAISAAVQDALPGRVGAFAAAITTGDRSGMDRATYDDLRASNLAHLLAISGLHMGLLTGFVFGALRLGLATVPVSVLRGSARKTAAIGALAAGVVYLALSGGNVATERAFIMVAVMFLGILVDRRAITLRAVAVAAMIVLMLRPEALYGPGFQMSFAATTALVAVYGAFRDHGVRTTGWPRWLRFVGGVALTSLIAGMATAPIGAAHFNQVPHYGIVANVLSVPLMGAVIIPAAVFAALLAPFGLGWVGLAVMAPPITWILTVAETVSGWEGAVSHVIAPGRVVLPMMALGGIWCVLWQGRGRGFGAVVAAFALFLWIGAERPPVLVSETGGLVGVMTPDGRALSKPQGDGFAADSWLENDGDPSPQADAFARAGFYVSGRQRQFVLGQAEILHATGKIAAQEAVARCSDVSLVIVNVAVNAPEACRIFDAKRLHRSGALAIYPSGDGVRIIEAKVADGRRLWSQ